MGKEYRDALLAAALIALAFLLSCSAGQQRDSVLSGRTTTPSIEGSDISRELMGQLRGALEQQLQSRGLRLNADGRAVSIASGREVSSVPVKQYLTPQRTDDPPAGNSNLYWQHFMRGDYDVNGEVNISDLTRVGQYFGKKAADPAWVSTYKVADGDGNGEINIADVTPIGQNFSAVIGAYAIEAREAAGEWREYGSMGFEQGFPSNNTLEYGYLCNGGLVEAEYRVRPVGRVRDFDWETYTLTDTGDGETYSRLGIVDGRPMLTYLSSEQSMATFLGFAVASVERPAVSDWYIEHKFLDRMDLDICPTPVSIQGRPALSYVRLDPGGATESLYFNIRDSGDAAASSWSEHMITGPAPFGFRTVTVLREGRPAVFYPGNGLKMFQAATAFPSSSGDWSGINCNPAFNDFRFPSVVASGPYLFACGSTATPSDYLVYSHSLGPVVSGPSDFSEYLLWPGVDTNEPSPLLLIGGIPCIACADFTQSALQFLQAAGRDVDSSANWFLHSVVSSPGADDFWYPTMALIEGRPAICSGYATKYFHWTGGQWPDSGDDWHHQTLDPGIQNQFVQIVSAGGLPILAYSESEGGGPPEIVIAVATEQ